MLNRFRLVILLLLTGPAGWAQAPLYDSLELAQQRIRRIVVLSDYKDADSSSVRVFDTLLTAQLARFQYNPLFEVDAAFGEQMRENGSNVLVEKRNATTGRSDFTNIMHYPAQGLIIATVSRNLHTDSSWHVPGYNQQHPADSLVYRYDNHQRLTEKALWQRGKLIYRESYTYQRNGLPASAILYDPRFLLSPEGTCVRRYVYLK